CDQGADHLYAIGLPFCQNTFGLGCVYDAPGGKDRNVHGCFNSTCQMNSITRGNMHGCLEREHMCAENATHRYCHIVNASRIHQETRYLKALFRCNSGPWCKLIGTEAHTQHTVEPDSSIDSFQGLLYEAQAILKWATIVI